MLHLPLRLRSNTVFRETPRYLLLYDLLLAETLQMVITRVLFLLATFSVFLIRIVCLLLLTLTVATTIISPFNLAVMSLQRYVALCFPLRYAKHRQCHQHIWGHSGGVGHQLHQHAGQSRVLMLTALDPRPLGQFLGFVCAHGAIFQNENILRV